MDKFDYDTKGDYPLRHIIAVLIITSIANVLATAQVSFIPDSEFGTYQQIIEEIRNPSDDYVMVVAHRGDWRHAPENSIQAVLNCIRMGVEIVEIDLRMTKDSQLIVIHDETLDRTTTGHGYVADKSLSEIQSLHLKNGAGGTTKHRVPTLRQMMTAVKDKPVLLNLDKAWSYLPETVELLKEMGALGQCIFKGNEPYTVMRKAYGSLLDSIIYMPIVWPPDYNIYKKPEDIIKDPIQYAQDYIEQLDPLAFEVIYSTDTSIIFEAIDDMRMNRTSVWVNALWGRLCANHHDELAIQNPEAHYGWIIDHGANIIQTDRPAFLIDYLENKGLRSVKKGALITDLIQNLENSTNDEVMVIAHRGDWRHAPENSLQAIQNCINMGVDMVEIDVRMTKDGQLVLMHDETIDRTTQSTGKVSDWTLSDLRTLKLVDALGVETEHRIPTLEEALRLVKGQILVNLDKSYSIFDECYEVMKETGTLEQVIIKGAKSKSEVESEFGKYLDEVYFMPIVRLADSASAHIVEAYMLEEVPIAFEFIVPKEGLPLIDDFKKIREAGAGVWVNSLWPQHNAGHDDERAANDLSTYDWYIDRGVDMIQTDRPELLLKYLRLRGLHR